MKKQKLSMLLTLTMIIILIIAGIGIGYIFTLYTYTYPHEKYITFKTNTIKEMRDTIISTKNKIKNNKKLGKTEYLTYKKYHNKKYLYHHNKIAISYLKKAAYNGYPKAEYEYSKHLITPIYLFHPEYNDKFNIITPSQVSKYAKSIALIENSAKQGYKPAMFQIALLHLYGSYPVKYYTVIGKYNKHKTPNTLRYNLIRFHFKNKKEAKKIFYKLASEKYIPAMIIVNNLYNKKIKLIDIYKLENIIHAKN